MKGLFEQLLFAVITPVVMCFGHWIRDQLMDAWCKVCMKDTFDDLLNAWKQNSDALRHSFFYDKLSILAKGWDQISFELQIWTIPKTKNGDSQIVPLTPSALEILRQRSGDEKWDPRWVFPSDRKGCKTGEHSHMGNPKEAWKRIVERAKIKDLRIHDLRRTAGSYLAIQELSPTIIGKALGHRSQAATAMYARLTQDPVRQALILAQATLANPQMMLKSESNVVELKQNEKTS